MKNVVVINTIKRKQWYFRVSTFEDDELDIYTIMVVLWNSNLRDQIYFRFFDDDHKAAAFVDACATGKYGDTLTDIDN